MLGPTANHQAVRFSGRLDNHQKLTSFDSFPAATASKTATAPNDAILHNVSNLIRAILGENEEDVTKSTIEKAATKLDLMQQEMKTLQDDAAASAASRVAFEIKELEWKIIKKERDRSASSAKKVTQKLLASQTETIHHLEARVAEQIDALGDKKSLLRLKDERIRELEALSEIGMVRPVADSRVVETAGPDVFISIAESNLVNYESLESTVRKHSFAEVDIATRHADNSGRQIESSKIKKGAPSISPSKDIETSAVVNVARQSSQKMEGGDAEGKKRLAIANTKLLQTTERVAILENAYTTDIAQLKATIAACEKNQKKLRESLSESTSETSRLTQQLEESRDQLKLSEQRCAMLLDGGDAPKIGVLDYRLRLCAKAGHSKEDGNSAGNNLDTSPSTVQAPLGENSDKQAKLNGTEVTIYSCDAAIDNVNGATALQELSRAKIALKDTISKLEATERRAIEVEESNVGLKQSLRAAEEKTCQLKERVTAANAKCLHYENELLSHSYELNETKQHLRAAEAQITDLVRDRECLVAQLDQVQLKVRESEKLSERVQLKFHTNECLAVKESQERLDLSCAASNTRLLLVNELQQSGLGSSGKNEQPESKRQLGRPKDGSAGLQKQNKNLTDKLADFEKALVLLRAQLKQSQKCVASLEADDKSEQLRNAQSEIEELTSRLATSNSRRMEESTRFKQSENDLLSELDETKIQQLQSLGVIDSLRNEIQHGESNQLKATSTELQEGKEQLCLAEAAIATLHFELKRTAIKLEAAEKWHADSQTEYDIAAHDGLFFPNDAAVAETTSSEHNTYDASEIHTVEARKNFVDSGSGVHLQQSCTFMAGDVSEDAVAYAAVTKKDIAKKPTLTESDEVVEYGTVKVAQEQALLAQMEEAQCTLVRYETDLTDLDLVNTTGFEEEAECLASQLKEAEDKLAATATMLDQANTRAMASDQLLALIAKQLDVEGVAEVQNAIVKLRLNAAEALGKLFDFENESTSLSKQLKEALEKLALSEAELTDHKQMLDLSNSISEEADYTLEMIASECDVADVAEFPRAFLSLKEDLSVAQNKLRELENECAAAGKALKDAVHESERLLEQQKESEMKLALMVTERAELKKLLVLANTKAAEGDQNLETITSECDVADVAELPNAFLCLKAELSTTQDKLLELKNQLVEADKAKEAAVYDSALLSEQLNDAVDKLALAETKLTDRKMLLDRANAQVEESGQSLQKVSNECDLMDISELQKMILSLKFEVSDTQGELLDSEREVERLQHELAEASKAVEDAAGNSARLSTQLGEAEYKLSLTEADLVDYKELLELATTEAIQPLRKIANECGVTDVSELHSVIMSMKAELLETQHKLLDCEKVIQRQQKEIAESSQATDYAKDAAATLSKQLQEDAEKLAAAEAELMDCTKVLQQALNECGVVDVSGLHSMIVTLITEVSEAQEKLKECECYRKRLDSENVAGSALSNETQQDSAREVGSETDHHLPCFWSIEAKVLVAKVSELESNNKSLALSLKQSQSEVAELSDSLVRLKDSNELARNDDKIDESTLRDEGACICGVSQSVQRLEMLLKRKEVDIESLHTEQSELQDQLTNARTALWDLEDERAYSRAKLIEFSKFVERPAMSVLEGKLYEATKRCANAIGESDCLKEKLLRSQATTKTLQEKIEKNKEIVRELKSRCDLSSVDVIENLEKEKKWALQKVMDVSVEMAENQMQVNDLRERLLKAEKATEESMDSSSRSVSVHQQAAGLPRKRGLSRFQPKSSRLSEIGILGISTQSLPSSDLESASSEAVIRKLKQKIAVLESENSAYSLSQSVETLDTDLKQQR